MTRRTEATTSSSRLQHEAGQNRFVSTQEFFKPRFAEAKIIGDRMMKRVLEAREDGG